MTHYTSEEIQNIQYVIDQAVIDYVEKRKSLREISDIVNPYMYRMAELSPYLSVDYLTKLDIVPDSYYWDNDDPEKLKTYHRWIYGWYNELKYGPFLLFVFYLYKKRLHEVRRARGEE